MRWTVLALALVVGCNGGGGSTDKGPGTTVTDGTPTPPTTTTEDGFCAVRRAFVQECVVCHDAQGAQGGLDLETDAIAALVNVTSDAYGSVLVAPGDPNGSLLYRKVAGTQSGAEGDEMPPDGAIPAVAATIRTWIADGATDACGTPGTTTEPGRYHPAGWDAPDVHGMATKFQTETDCRQCHGQDLGGGTSGVACDDCHAPRWETDCTFCHGGVLSTTGAPPEDIDDNDDPDTISFPPHEVHLSARITAQWDCDKCHVKPTEALTPGHLFDDPTAGVAEVVVVGGATWSMGTCSDVYCHGNGRRNGDISLADGPRDCGDCHGDSRTPTLLSGRHVDHIREGIACAECHADAQGSNAIDQPAMHVDTHVDVNLPAAMTWTAATNRCDGTCHFERHSGRTW